MKLCDIDADFLGITEDEFTELRNDKGNYKELTDTVASNKNIRFYVYGSVEELGKDNSDNGTREEDDTDEGFGEYLLEAYSYNGTFWYRFSNGRILVEGQ